MEGRRKREKREDRGRDNYNLIELVPGHQLVTRWDERLLSWSKHHIHVHPAYPPQQLLHPLIIHTHRTLSSTGTTTYYSSSLVSWFAHAWCTEMYWRPNLTCILHRPLMLPIHLPATRTAFNDRCRDTGIAISSKTTPTWCLVDLCTQDCLDGVPGFSNTRLERTTPRSSVLCKCSRAILELPPITKTMTR